MFARPSPGRPSASWPVARARASKRRWPSSLCPSEAPEGSDLTGAVEIPRLVHRPAAGVDERGAEIVHHPVTPPFVGPHRTESVKLNDLRSISPPALAQLPRCGERNAEIPRS
jgi:hypothetical protein